MPLPVLPGVLRITAGGLTAGGGRWANTWHAYNGGSSAWDTASILLFHGRFSIFYLGPPTGAGQHVMGKMNSAATCDGFDYTPLDGSSGALHVTAAGVGGAATAPMPGEVAEVLTIRTASRGRQNRGRVFLPAFATGEFDAAGHINAAAVAEMVAQATAVQAALVAAGETLGVGSYGPYKDPVTHALITSGQHFTPVSSFSMDNRADVQRRRKA